MMIDLLRVEKAIIENVREESPNVKTLTIKPERNIDFKPGQFAFLSKLGIGESPFAISSNPLKNTTFDVSIQKIGKNTSALHELEEGEEIWFRGPYGNYFPVEKWKGKKIIIIAGGIGMAPMRSLLYSILNQSQDYQGVELLHAAQNYEKFIYKNEFTKWETSISVKLIVEKPSIVKNIAIGLVTDILEEQCIIDIANSVICICGPNQMIQACIGLLKSKGIKSESIFVSLERKMKCGIGICGKCGVGNKHICKDGPVFRLDEVEEYFQQD
jgi:NAD(P)H-flavin reductase